MNSDEAALWVRHVTRQVPSASVALRDDMARSRRRRKVTDGKSDARYPASIAFLSYAAFITFTIVTIYVTQIT
ncbi:hypothetical protein [Streptomyces sp. NPDC102283]|uniref:hypothetical protein n=1 Tax=Streptomyces sp. NPDC102283 TaxID=3366155 RepID=UPI003810967D